MPRAGRRTGAQEADIRQTAGPPSSNQVGVVLVGSATNPAGSITAVDGAQTYTPTNRFFITDIIITSDISNAAPKEILILSGGITIFRAWVSNTGPVNAPGIETQPSAGAGQAVTLSATLTGNIDWMISGYEQDGMT